MRRSAWLVVGISCLGPVSSALPCSLCSNVKQIPTFRQEASSPSARVILFGTVTNPRFLGQDPGSGVSDFTIEVVLKADATLPRAGQFRRGARIEVPYYLPVTDPEKPPQQLIFCDYSRERLDVYRSVPATAALVRYFEKTLELAALPSTQRLLAYFDYLDHDEPGIAQDAFLEFAKVTDQEVGVVAPQLSAKKVRRWLQAKDTPPERRGLYAFILGCCGSRDDLRWFRTEIAQTLGTAPEAIDGLLSGLIQLSPEEGWDQLTRMFADGNISLGARLAAVRTMRFYLGWKPTAHRRELLRSFQAMLDQGELVDLAVEELRRAEWWEQTPLVLKQFGRAGLDAPIQRRAIVRYALCCPRPEATAFIKQIEQQQPELVRDVRESLEFDRR